MCLYLVFVRMVFKRKGVKRADSPGPAKLHNDKLNWGFPKHFAIKIHVAALQVKVFNLVVRRSLLAALVFDTPRLTGTETGGVDHHIRFEERPEHLVRDFVVLE